MSDLEYNLQYKNPFFAANLNSVKDRDIYLFMDKVYSQGIHSKVRQRYQDRSLNSNDQKKSIKVYFHPRIFIEVKNWYFDRYRAVTLDPSGDLPWHQSILTVMPKYDVEADCIIL